MKHNRIHQRVLSILLSLGLIFSIFAIDTIGASAASGDGRIEKSLDSGNITITDSGSYVITQQNREQSVTNTITVDSGIAPDIELQNVNIDVSGSDTNQCAFSIAPGASVRLTLTGTNTLVSGGGCAGLRVPASTTPGVSDASLTITDQSTGSLNVTGAGYDYGEDAFGGAGIGGNNNESGGKITINGGTVTAQGGENGAGIGGGDVGKGTADGGKISISGGTVTATGGESSAGIGGGGGGYGTGTGDCSGSEISVSGGTVTATGGFFGAGIGGGNLSNGTGTSGTITVSGGTVTATGGGLGTGIGGGFDGSGTSTSGSVQIKGENTEVTAQGGGQWSRYWFRVQ